MQKGCKQNFCWLSDIDTVAYISLDLDLRKNKSIMFMMNFVFFFLLLHNTLPIRKQCIFCLISVYSLKKNPISLFLGSDSHIIPMRLYLSHAFKRTTGKYIKKY